MRITKRQLRRIIHEATGAPWRDLAIDAEAGAYGSEKFQNDYMDAMRATDMSGGDAQAIANKLINAGLDEDTARELAEEILNDLAHTS